MTEKGKQIEINASSVCSHFIRDYFSAIYIIDVQAIGIVDVENIAVITYMTQM